MWRFRRQPVRTAATRLNREAPAPVRRGWRWPDAASAAAVAMLVLCLLWLALSWQQGTAIRQVQLAGELHQTRVGELQDAVDAVVRGSFFSANLREVQQVAERHPWVAQVRVRRQWPDTLVVVVREHVPVARWGEQALVTADGVIFRPRQRHRLEGLPQLQGPREQVVELLAQHEAMSRLLRQVGLRIQRLTLTERRSWELTLEEGIRVLVDDEDTLAKLARFIVLYDRQLVHDMARIARIDLRYRNGVAVAWRPGPRA